MNFEDAYKKLQEGTATDEEAAFVARELENVRKISALLENPSSDSIIAKADTDTVQKARKTYNRKAIIRTITITVISLLLIAAVICGIIFIPSTRSAASKLKISSDEAISLGRSCMSEYIGEEAEEFYVDHMYKHLEILNSLNNAVYIYRIEFENENGDEIDVEINSKSGYARITDVDVHG